MALQILEDVTTTLERKYGVIRYVNDQYYNEGAEAEWCFGFPWLGLCFYELGMYDKANGYVEKTKRIITGNWEIPELYIGGKYVPNGNKPLAWSVSLAYQFFKTMDVR